MTVDTKTILIVALTAIITFNVSSFFRKSPPNEKLIRSEMKIEHLEEKRKSDSLLYVERLKAKDDLFQLLQQKDTVIIRNINSSNDRIKKIPAAVNNLDKQQLRGAFTNF